jgi:hypothetical protein
MTTSRANAAPSADTDDGRHRAIYPAAADPAASIMPPWNRLSTVLY